MPVQHRRSRHWDEAVVGVKNAIRSRPPPYPGAATEANLFLLLSYAQGDHLVGEDDPLLMLWTMLVSAPTQAEVPTDDAETRGVGYVERRASTARDRREP